jgi:hypothetical protein
MRARNIKPGFFTNDALLQCHPLARLLFAALWGIADREGRLEDRPKLIKVKALPGDDCDIVDLLDELADVKLIERYSVDGENYIQVVNFLKHQNPHHREPESKLPPKSSLGKQVMDGGVSLGKQVMEEAISGGLGKQAMEQGGSLGKQVMDGLKNLDSSESGIRNQILNTNCSEFDRVKALPQARKIVDDYRKEISPNGHRAGAIESVVAILEERPLPTTETNLRSAMGSYRAETSHVDPQYRLGAAKFFGSGEWLEYLDSPRSPPGFSRAELIAKNEATIAMIKRQNGIA